MFRTIPLFLLILLPSASGAQDAPERDGARYRVHIVRASGEATVTAKPDQAEVSIAVLNQAPNAQTASEQNATETTRVLEAVKRELGSNGQLKTAGYSISPDYQYENGHAPKITGYTATNTIAVTITNLSLIGKIIDAATSSGANRIQAVSFSLKDDEDVRAEALAQAAKKARSNAEAIARALNVRVVGLLEAESGQPAVIRPRTMLAQTYSRAAADAPTPIEPTSIDIHATVTVALEVQ